MKWTQLIPFRRTVNDTRRQVAGSARNISAGLSTYRRFFCQVQGDAAKKNTFADALAAWGLSAEHIPAAKKALKIEICVWLAMTSLMFAGARTTSSGWIITQLAIVAMVCLFSSIARAWRYWVLAHQQFVPFKYWIFGQKIKDGGKE